MAARLAAALPRFVVLTPVILLATAGLTLAAQETIVAPPAAQAPPAAKPEILVVPNVRGQAYVFAKGMLEDAGFAWRVVGRVHGYAANTVASQLPAAGTRVLDNGAPTIVLELRRNPSYMQEGTPEDASPYQGSAIRLAVAPRPTPARRAAPPTSGARVVTKPAAKKPKPVPKPKARAKPKSTQTRVARRPAFVVPNAPKEPLDEMSLPARARRLDAWLSAHRKPTNANVRAYLYQHSWIVTGAKFGWWRGAEALRILVRVDRRADKLWGIGARSERVAQAALRTVQARSR